MHEPGPGETALQDSPPCESRLEERDSASADAAQRAACVQENLQLNDREYRLKKTRLLSFPHYIQIGADNRCNLKCGFCLAAADREKGMLHIQDRKMEHNAIEIFRRLQPYMKYWATLSLTGPGESLLNPQLESILQMIRSQSDCFIVITTNGVLIDEKLAEAFVRTDVSEIAISMDSLRKETYEELRLNARFEDVLAAIDRLNEAKKRYGRGPNIALQPNFSTLNIEELPDFIDFASARGIYKVQATPTQVYRTSWVERSLLHHPDLTRRMALEAERRAAQQGIEFSNELRMVYAPQGWRARLSRRREFDFPTDPSDCRKPWASLYVEPDGEVRPCCYQSPIYGDLFQSDFESLWNGEEARRLRRSMIEGEPPQPCRDCYEFNRHDPSVMIQV